MASSAVDQHHQHQHQQQQQQHQERDLTEDELKQFGKNLWPARAVDNVDELKELLDCQFFGDEEEADDTDKQWTNFSAYTRKVGGFQWINALHPFDNNDGAQQQESSLLSTPLTYILEREPDEWRFVSFLLQMGADPNVRDGKGRPPLFHFLISSCMMRRYRTFSLLMESGANALALYAGKTMIGFAKELKGNSGDQLDQMVWEEFQRKYGISDDMMEEQDDDEDFESDDSD